jgi:hypothetical protein
MLSEASAPSDNMTEISQLKIVNENNTSVYRYKLEPHIVESVTRFAKVHQYDTLADYKEAWKVWCDEESGMIERETRRLYNLGYDGDVMDKLYKAGRYYFRTKNLHEDKKPQQRQYYVSMDTAILDAMDDHIRSYYDDDDFSPAEGYNWFVNQYKIMLMGEIKRILDEKPDLQANYISSKIKKTYKNRYYLFASNKN